MALAVIAGASSSVRAQAGGARLGAIASSAGAGGYRWIARERQSSDASGHAWTISAGSTSTGSFVCIEHSARDVRCWDVEASSPSIVMPTVDGDRAIEIRLGYEPSPGSLVHLVFEFRDAAADPVFALVDALQTGRPLPTPPRVMPRTDAPTLLASLADVDAAVGPNGYVFLMHEGAVVGCHVASDADDAAWTCGAPVRVARADARLELEADEQAGRVVGLEILATTPNGAGFEQRESVVLFDRESLAFVATLPMGGVVLTRPSAGSTDEDRTEVAYELWEPVTPTCVRIDPPDVVRTAIVRGHERSLRAPRLSRVSDAWTATAFDAQPVLVDVAGFWETSSAGLRRVASCPTVDVPL